MKIYLIERKRWIHICVCSFGIYSHAPSARWYIIFIDLLNHHQSTLFMAVLRICRKPLTCIRIIFARVLSKRFYHTAKLNGIACYSSHENWKKCENNPRLQSNSVISTQQNSAHEHEMNDIRSNRTKKETFETGFLSSQFLCDSFSIFYAGVLLRLLLFCV